MRKYVKIDFDYFIDVQQQTYQTFYFMIGYFDKPTKNATYDDNDHGNIKK